MTLSSVTSRVAQLERVQQLSRAKGTVSASGLLSAAYPAVLAALAHNARVPLLVITSHPQSALRVTEDIRAWSRAPVAMLPAIETLPFERVPWDRTVLAQRAAAAQLLVGTEPAIVIAPVRALVQQLSGHSRKPFVVQAGAQMSPDAIVTELVARGYGETGLVDQPGTYARRGGVMDIFPVSGSIPARLDMFGNDIESIREFDPSTQRSIRTIKTIQIDALATVTEPLRARALAELRALPVASMRAEAETLWAQDLERLEHGGALDEIPLLAPYLVDDTAHVLSILPQNGLVVTFPSDDVDHVREDLYRQAGQALDELSEAGEIPPGLRPMLISESVYRESIRDRRVIHMGLGTPSTRELDLSDLFAPATLYAGRLRAFVRDIGASSERHVVVATQQDERLEEILRDESIPIQRLDPNAGALPAGVSFVHTTLSEGWTCSECDVRALTDHELFGAPKGRVAPKKRRAARESFFTDFAPGDYVVHLEHGVGRFDGIRRMSISGVEREYAIVQYAGTDMVYVPTDQLERLTRYVGMGQGTPQLNKLGGGEWQRARQRAKKAAEDIAHELVDIYAKRMARTGHAYSLDTPWQHELESSFPYLETADQLRAVEDVKADMELERPMDRLVCADVGYGKTEVAVRAACKAVMDGRQVAVLVPTTILAQQHYETFTERFAPFPVKIEVMSRFRTPLEQRATIQRLATGEVDVIIGTHRLLSKDIVFRDLGLLVVDEEQRFGVKHKERLKRLRETIDVLTLTATPIPRTLHMGLVGLREISVIETAPEGRLPIKTFLQPFDDRAVREAVIRELDRDGQVYVVHNKVASIQAMAEKIRQLVPEARVLVGHGQMDEAQLEQVMLDFAHGRGDILVCSTIIENGLDIPNVNTIIVNHAEQLGLTQLYQLRGRVGRSLSQAYAYLLYPRDVRLTREARKRMEAVFEAQDLGAGFNIAMKDLEIRGAGNLLGAEQSGHASAVGFDLYTRMIGEAVEHLRGVPVEERPMVTVDLPLTMYIPDSYVTQPETRLTLYRRLAVANRREELDALRDEMIDRFGALPEAVEHLLTSVGVKLTAAEAHVVMLSLSEDHLVVRGSRTALFDRVSLYKRYGTDAKVSTNVLRIPRHRLGQDWMGEILLILTQMQALRASIAERAMVGAS